MNSGNKMALALSVILTFVILSTEAAVPHKRSIASRDTTNEIETCRSDAICGWEVYERYQREPLYYVANTCKCSTEETCIRTGDDISTSSYVYRCRVVRRNKNKNRNQTSSSTQQATSGPNSTASTS